MEETGLAFARFMDDWAILAPTRWKLRKANRVANQTLAELHIEPHPDKPPSAGSAGASVPGHCLQPGGAGGCPPTIERCAQRVSQLYEQCVALLHIGAYVQRWLRRARSGLRHLGAGLSERVLELVVRSLGRLGWPGRLPHRHRRRRWRDQP